ncbi:MAG TPA: DNA alkylation repair protein [candidate division Zixibacteria bacterium]|nr:DNA alkylation repair protein [candidate division Zixibacteria bacterium]
MDKIDRAYRMMQTYFKENANPKIIEKYSRFFREGYDPFGVDPHKLSPQIEVWYSGLEPDFKISDFKKLFTKLMDHGKDEDLAVVINFLRLMKKYHSPTLFKNIKSYVSKYFTNWAQVDSLCARTISEMILNDVVSYDDLLAWQSDESKWVRRCVPVGTVYGFYKQKDIKPVKKVAEALISDPVREVGQGVGWMLRDAWKVYPDQIEKLLLNHVKTGNRTAYQYACEKMDKEYRKKFRRPKRQ